MISQVEKNHLVVQRLKIIPLKKEFGKHDHSLVNVERVSRVKDTFIVT